MQVRFRHLQSATTRIMRPRMRSATASSEISMVTVRKALTRAGARSAIKGRMGNAARHGVGLSPN
jgi:hypothetical protein